MKSKKSHKLKIKGKEEFFLNKKKKIIIAIVILAIMLAAFIGGQAYAKYVSQVRGNGKAEIATWNFKVNGQKEEVQEIKLASTYNNNTLVNNKIAPGTRGSFNIVIDTTGSEVGIDYKINFKDDVNKPKNLMFIYESEGYTSLKELENKLSGTINANDENKIRTINIQWIWNYETGTNKNEIDNNDIIDTNNASSIANYTFQTIVTGTQVKPKA